MEVLIVLLALYGIFNFLIFNYVKREKTLEKEKALELKREESFKKNAEEKLLKLHQREIRIKELKERKAAKKQLEKEESTILKHRIVDNINSVVDEHIDALHIKYKQLSSNDAYGNLILKKFYKELEYFIEKVINPRLGTIELPARMVVNISENITVGYEYTNSNQKTEINAWNPKVFFIDFIKPRFISMPADSFNTKIETGHEYELLCKQIFESYNWQVVETQKTGDQGVDLIAKKENKTLAIQCKFYKKPVGNKAVQEVFSGASYYNAKECIVIAPKGYTKSAIELASSLNVKCIHHDEIAKL